MSNNKIKLFLVDDDAVFLKSLEIDFIQKADFEITTFSTGELCLKSISQAPDVIILDVMMPGLDGFEVARELKADNQTKQIAILMLTAIKDKMGFDFQKEGSDPNWLPVDDYCNKPLDYEVLLGKVDHLVQNKKS